ncbi:phage major tail tube protein [Tardiphaga sp. 709]|jgi:uncharacterized protein|uniref:phage major tail tube protein n=1 Tax=unclassified Tardiphaga TaxID=2631404 RepID=UPI0028E4AD86|nr:phage major tail tube protein [Tardiphaga sp. 709]WNV10088.1 phage major tail tube protein [Tardiphaga sp. 709]
MSLHIQEAVTLFVGDDGPNNSKHLNLSSIKLPTLEEKSQTHFGGGAIGEITIGGLGLSALEVTFGIKGYDPQIMSQFGLGVRRSLNYTMYGAVRDIKGNAPVELKAVIQGRMLRLEGDDLQRGELVGHSHTIQEILHYALFWNGVEKYYYDFWTSDWRVDGVSQNADIRNILRIPGAS